MTNRDKLTAPHGKKRRGKERRSLPNGRLPLYESSEELRVRMWVQLMRTFSIMQKEVSVMLANRGLTIAQFDVMATLEYAQGVTQQELAEKLLVTKGNICGLIDRLEDVGWVERRADPNDARARRLYVTATGRRRLEEVYPEHATEVVSLTGTLCDSDVVTLRNLLWQLEHGICEERK